MRALLLSLLLWVWLPLAAAADGPPPAAFPPPIESYGDAAVAGVGAKLLHRIKAEPFNLVASVIFFLAILHTFLVAKFRHVGHAAEHAHEKLSAEHPEPDEAVADRLDGLRFKATVFHFLGEVEAVFGIWLLALFGAFVAFRDFSTAVHYLNGVNYAEPIFVTVIMAIAGTRPVIVFAEQGLSRLAGLVGGSGAAWWWAILIGGAALGSFITEPAAMTLCALLLAQRFYVHQPSMRFRYATLGLLFVNVSVGGTLTHFAAPPVVMVASKWGWDTPFMFTNIGWKALLGMALSTALYAWLFRRELAALPANPPARRQRRIPVFVTIAHLFFLAWAVLNAHYPALLVIAFLFFVAFHAATESHQDTLAIRGPLLVGFFLAALVAHGGCQQWWIEPVLGAMGPLALMVGATILTGFNDNAAITYLASLVPGFSPEMKYAVMCGAVTGGGLTVIANAPNPAGQSILQPHFGEDGVSPVQLFVWALAPTVIVGLCFWLLRS
ncbi:MAG: putative Na+/H+ antiporter [Verrucomicrobia bacterium]|nr:putative Na+/H+ antiporter [Verrucomicrobiota bacterium]